jgi:hypothetical protein
MIISDEEGAGALTPLASELKEKVDAESRWSLANEVKIYFSSLSI